jgi:hypothetical protein
MRQRRSPRTIIRATTIILRRKKPSGWRISVSVQRKPVLQTKVKRRTSSGPKPSRSRKKRRQLFSKERKPRPSVSANARPRRELTSTTLSRNLSVEVVAAAEAEEVDVEANVGSFEEDAVAAAVAMASEEIVKGPSVATVKVASVATVKVASVADEDVVASEVNSEVVVESFEDVVGVDAAVLTAALRSPSLMIRPSPALDPHKRPRCLDTSATIDRQTQLSFYLSFTAPKSNHHTGNPHTFDQPCTMASSLDGMTSKYCGQWGSSS